MSILLYLTLFLIAVRSSLDIFTNKGFHISWFFINIPSAISISIIVIAIIYIIFKNGKISINGLGRAFFLWIVSMIPFTVMSIYNFSYNGLNSLREFIRLFSLFLAFLLFYNFTTKYNLVKILNCLFISLIVPSVVAIYQLITKTGMIDKTEIHRIYGTMSHPNTFAFFLVFFVVLTYLKIREEKSIPWVLLLLLEFFLLIQTFSLAGYIMLIIIVFYFLSKLTAKQKIAVIILLFLLLCIVFNLPQFQTRLDRIKMIDIKKTLVEKEVVDSFTWRICNWLNLLSLWSKKPLTGYGLNTISIINPWKTEYGIGYAAHNDYINYLVETGLLGVLFYVIFISYVCFFIYKECSICMNKKVKELLCSILFVFMALQFVSFFHNIITATTVQLYFWVVCGSFLKVSKLLQ